MLTLSRIRRIQLSGRPRFQRVLASSLMLPNYNLPPRVRIRFEGFENVPDRPVIFAMNHTDRYNYWPFQTHLWRKHDRYTCTWVKGKYFQNPLVGKLLEWANNIPAVSRGYLLSRDFVNVMGRPPKTVEYQKLREMIEAVATARATGEAQKEVDGSLVPEVIFTRPRDLLGRDFDPTREDYATAIVELFNSMMGTFTDLNADARELGLDTLIFPQGTRSVHLSKGHGGISQIALKQRRTVIPVGCNGSNKIYTSSSPIASKGGDIVYRFGEPITYDEMERFHIEEDFQPFTPKAEFAHNQTFQDYVDVVMERINELLDPEYQFAVDEESDGVEGTARFV
ncbi:MAG: hypothetical protein DRJ42_10485 [Deltaproteobacteria bacterium]|nr:MAG: hypothetical protein DRJ42_10485 [Deltaproteobacteria bacterium]